MGIDTNCRVATIIVGYYVGNRAGCVTRVTTIGPVVGAYIARASIRAIVIASARASIRAIVIASARTSIRAIVVAIVVASAGAIVGSTTTYVTRRRAGAIVGATARRVTRRGTTIVTTTIAYGKSSEVMSEIVTPVMLCHLHR